MISAESEAPPRFSARGLMGTAVAGLVCGFLAIVLSISLGSLLFSGDFLSFLPVALGLALFSTTVMAAISALTSSTRGIAIAEEIPVVALGAVVAATGAGLSSLAAPDERLATIIVAVAAGTAVTGIFAFLLGYFRLGNLIRFAPYPVIGGFLAGTGWIILSGGIGVVIDESLTLSAIAGSRSPASMVELALTAAFVAALFLAPRLKAGPLAAPAIILAVLVLFNIAAALIGASPESLRDAGWLIRLPDSGRLWPPIGPADLALVDWRAVAVGMVSVPTVMVMTVIALLMNATGIELEAETDIDLDQELRSVGAMNLVAGAGGGLPGYPAISLTLLAARLGGDARSVGLIVSALCLVALVFGNVVLDAVPAMILGGVLVWIGAELLIEWLVHARRRLSPREYLIVLLIFAIIVGAGFAIGIFVGAVAAVVLFVFEYGGVSIVRHELTGGDYQSSVEASENRQEALLAHGDAILIIRLQGFLFFGTADGLRRHIQKRVAAGPRTRFLVIDFHRVTGLDSSAVLSFRRLAQVAARERFVIVLTGMSEDLHQALARGGLAVGPPVRIESTIAQGLKWCEDTLLAEERPDIATSAPRPLAALLAALIEDAELAGRVAFYCTRVEIGEGESLITAGTPSDDIFLIESGSAAVELDAGRATPIRLATVGPGALVGETSFYLREPRSASIVAEEAMIAWRFSRESLGRLQAEAPDAALRFHQGIAAMLSRRLIRTNRLVRFLAD